MKKIILTLFAVAILGSIAYVVLSETQILNRSSSDLPRANVDRETDPTTPPENIPRISVVADNLSVPWSIEFLPGERIITTERSGDVKLIDGNNVSTIAQINVTQTGESGLHGVTLDPEFQQNNYIYLYYTTSTSGENTLNRVSRYTFTNDSLNNETILVDDIPGAQIHDGGRIKFGPDDYLYITTGDAANPSLSQDTDSVAGKILRVDRTGNAHPDNPFGNLVYSYGHRNPQGITWNDTEQLFSTEHGNDGTDEFNRITMGENYGWPNVIGNQTSPEITSPLIQSGNDTWAPAGLTFINGSFYFAGLRGNALYEVTESNGQYQLSEHLAGEFGRLRAVTKGPDNMLYIGTSNRDGRGIPANDDDKILRVNPQKL